ncbi:family 16 glycosylhydrolase [Ligilactobacillus sp. Marseille-Q7487]|uniref:family 16 glycosylhydrolase n=1 Tax=Ligilactobacillus sp. Marseille-Q7487 TaxID=3022128 RepID=UPI0024A92A42|nr:family 16 glycosylhydrolase [Ligilactobacillus sp. Marseille-Q7487]
MIKYSKLAHASMALILMGSYAATVATTPHTILAATKNEVKHEHELVDLQTDNLLQNGNFENADNNWNIVGQDSGVIKDEKSGSNMAVLNKTTDNHANGHIWQDVTLKKHTTYVLSAKVKVQSSNPSDYITFDVKKGDVNVANYFKDLNVYADTGEWQDVSLEFMTDDTTLFAVGIGRWFDQATSSQKNTVACMDDVKLKEKSTAQDDNYNIIWADDFNEQQLDTSKWDYELGSIRGVEQEHYVNSKENVDVSDGTLKLRLTDRAKEDQYTNPRGDRKVIYNSGSIRTHGKQEFLYGRIEIRAKLPKGKGVFPAFWTLGSDFTLDGKINSQQGAPWPVSGEMDIMELIGQDGDTSQGNKTVYQTLHYGDAADKDNGKYAGNGTSYALSDGTNFNDGYHIFGINWSKGKVEWYVDNKIVRTVDYSNDPLALKTLDRPQYVQLNLAAGGNWPGDAGANLAGQEFDVDYIYYAQNEQQKADAQQYYANAAKITGAKDVTMTQGEIPDLLAGVTSDKNTKLDFSVDDEYQFQNTGGNTNVHLVCSGKDDAAKLATLPAGKYNLYYSAVNTEDKTIPATRKAVLLTVKPRSLATDLAANGLKAVGYAKDTLASIALPDGWSWDKPDTVLVQGTQKVSATYSKNGFTMQESIDVTGNASVSKEQLQAQIAVAQKLVTQTDKYTAQSLATLQTSLTKAKAVLEQLDPTYAQMTLAYQDLENAQKQLVLKDVQKPAEPTQDKQDQVILESKKDDKNSKLPQAGENKGIILSALGLLTAGVSVVALFKRK